MMQSQLHWPPALCPQCPISRFVPLCLEGLPGLGILPTAASLLTHGSPCHPPTDHLSWPMQMTSPTSGPLTLTLSTRDPRLPEVLGSCTTLPIAISPHSSHTQQGSFLKTGESPRDSTHVACEALHIQARSTAPNLPTPGTFCAFASTRPVLFPSCYVQALLATEPQGLGAAWPPAMALVTMLPMIIVPLLQAECPA